MNPWGGNRVPRRGSRSTRFPGSTRRSSVSRTSRFWRGGWRSASPTPAAEVPGRACYHISGMTFIRLTARGLAMAWRIDPRAGIVAGILLVCLRSLDGAAEEKGPPVDFNREVRAILSRNCYACHGPDAEHRKAGLRLDLRDAALGKLETGAIAVVPGKPDDSELVARITSTDPAERMPPKDTGRQLTPAEVALLQRWIAEGASYAEHWSFIRPVRPALPKVAQAGWPKNDIDRFILGRLEPAGLPPVPEADRYTLIRRLSLDLRGLPPT